MHEPAHFMNEIFLFTVLLLKQGRESEHLSSPFVGRDADKPIPSRPLLFMVVVV